MIRHGLIAALALVLLAACSAAGPTATTGPLATGGAPASSGSPAAETTPAETGGAEASPGSSLTATCVAALSVKQSILALNQLDPATASLEQLHNDVLTVRTAYQNFLVQAREQAQSQVAALQSAVDDLKNVDAGLPANATPRQAFEALRTGINGVLDAVDNVGSALGCPVVD